MSKKTVVKRTNSQLSVTQSTAGCTPASRCEELLDAAIYRCLHALTKRHEPTDDFKAQFCRGAFLKPNTKAFIQVLHFLFNVYDAREFRKRFYWPIYDKGAENAFRTSTVEYVNSLIERGKLVGMEKIKAHVVVLPGGAKFMKFLLYLIRFVLQEELRKVRGGSTGGEVLTRIRIAQMIASHKRWTEMGDRIHDIIHEEVALLSKSTRKIDDLLAAALEGCDLAKQMPYDKLMHVWSVLIATQFREHENTHQRVMAIGKEFEHIVERTGSKLKATDTVLPFTKEQLKDCLGKYNCQPGTEMHRLIHEVFDANGKLNPLLLIELFQTLLPGVEHFFSGFCIKSPEIMKYEYKELSKVAVRFEEIRVQMDVLHRAIASDDGLLRDHPGNGDSPEMGKDNFAIKNKLFCTPPIMMDFEAHPDDFHTTGVAAGGRNIHRLALLNKEDVHAMNARMKLLSVSAYQPRGLKTTQKSLNIPSEQQGLPQSSPNMFAVPRPARKEKLNPLTMLNRIKAQSQKQPGNGNNPPRANVAAVNSTMNISTLSEISLRPDFSSTLLVTPEKVGPAAIVAARTEDEAPEQVLPMLAISTQQQYVQSKRPIHSPSVQSSPRLMNIYVGSTTPKSVPSPKALLLEGPGGKRSITSKRCSLIETESFHTSPSGRLDSMLKLPVALERTVAASATDGQEPGDISDEKTLSLENGGQLVDLSRTLLADAERYPDTEHATNVEPPKTVEPDEDNLFNVSDGVLTDFD